MLFAGDLSDRQRHLQTECKRMEKIFQANGVHKHAGIAIIVCVKAHFKQKWITRDKGHAILLKEIIDQEEIAPLLLGRFPSFFFFYFEAIVNGRVFLISFSEDSSLMNRNALDLCVLILYPATLLNSFMSSRKILVELFGSSKYRIMSLANSDSLSSSFPI